MTSKLEKTIERIGMGISTACSVYLPYKASIYLDDCFHHGSNLGYAISLVFLSTLLMIPHAYYWAKEINKTIERREMERIANIFD